MDKPIYASHSTALMLWNTFNVAITLDTIFCQQGHTEPQIQFHKILQNIRNVVPIKQDWETLMTRTKDNLNEKQNIDFDNSTHLFATNEHAIKHNRKMLKTLNLPIARSTARVVAHNSNEHIEDEQLPEEVLLCICQ